MADEVVVAVYPALLGRGKRCFAEGIPAQVSALVSTQATPTGSS